MFKAFDLFPKLQDDLQQRQTICGGFLFLITLSTILLLITYEIFMTFIVGELHVSQFVSQTDIDERIRVNLNMSFHKVPCVALTLDLQDVTGTHLEDVQHTLHKLRLNQNGDYIDPYNAQRVAAFEHYINYPSNPINKYLKRLNKEVLIDDCYGAQLYEGQRCITCQDVMVAYAARNWPQPPKEAVAQCMPDHRAHVKKVDEPQANQLIIQGMGGIQQVTIVTEEPRYENANEKRIIQEKIKEIEDMVMETAPSRNINEDNVLRYQQLTEQQHTDLFMKRLKNLGELQMEPFHYLGKEEKNAQIKSLIEMMDTPFSEFDDQMQHQIEWEDTDKVLFVNKVQNQVDWRNLTTLKRKKCEIEAVIKMKLQNGHQFEVQFPKDVCELIVREKPTGPNQISIQIGSTQYIWDYNLEEKKSYDMLEIEIIDITGADYRMFDVTRSYFRIQMNGSIRKLFTEDFGHEQPKQQILFIEDIADIQQHSNEGCQVYGHFFIKKVPGNFHVSFHGRGQAAMLLDSEFSIKHTIHLLEFTDEKEEITLGNFIKSTNPIDGVSQDNQNHEDSQYYLKIVGGHYETIWTSAKKIFTFTSHESKKQSEGKLPQVEFKYEFDGITMKYVSRRKSLGEFFVSILAVVGGVFAVSNLFNRLLEKWNL